MHKDDLQRIGKGNYAKIDHAFYIWGALIQFGKVRKGFVEVDKLEGERPH